MECIPPYTLFYIEKLGFAGVYLYFLIFAPKHRLYVPVLEPPQRGRFYVSKHIKTINFPNEIFDFYERKNNSLHILPLGKHVRVINTPLNPTFI